MFLSSGHLQAMGPSDQMESDSRSSEVATIGHLIVQKGSHSVFFQVSLYFSISFLYRLWLIILMHKL